ncbi:carbohydrate ABC transporter permease [Metabacillus halosaccharovorans]|uniref:carbohydrate ABC transporter permease n=1 Tax=Metabacillus halosaccharovorans TaxID=930124 RepID=UPI00203A8FDA|nr:carbohydrate ABC transporter permease [Metabacillus halosaccharovorans]MCM3443071.1 carbohydrate ABC transporter permease [Metabacillus halosaccharovorans]
MKKLLKNPIIYISLIIFSLINVYPIVWMVINSFKSQQEFSLDPFFLPDTWRWDNYIDAWQTANLGTYFFNSIFVAVISVVVTVLFGALASYFLARFTFKMNKLVYVLFIFGMIIPIHATLVPMFILMNNLGLLNTGWTLLFPYVAFNLPLTIFILTSFMKAFPKDIEESAIMDGCGIFRIFWSIILPMSRPAIATVTILNFIHCWNEFSFALVLINDESLKTIPLGLANFAGQYNTNYTGQMAGLTMVIIPTILLYVLLEKHIVKGMTAGAVKG